MRNQVSASTLAKLLGVSEKAITRLTKLGVIAPAPHGRYYLQASDYSYCAFLRAMTARGGEGAEVDEISLSKSSKDEERH